MSLQRLLLAIALLVNVATALIVPGNQRNNLIVGSVGPYERQVYVEHFKINAKWFMGIKESKTFSNPTGKNISMVKLLDQKGTGGTAKIISGGPSKSFVTVVFESPRGHGVDFIIELYGS